MQGVKGTFEAQVGCLNEASRVGNTNTPGVFFLCGVSVLQRLPHLKQLWIHVLRQLFVIKDCS